MKTINKKLIISIALIIITLICLTNNTLATFNPNDDKWNPNPHIDSGGGFLEKAGTVLGVIKFSGIIISVVALTIIGIKYLLSSVEGKAEYKKTMLPYVIGVILIFAAVNLTAVIYNAIPKNETTQSTITNTLE